MNTFLAIKTGDIGFIKEAIKTKKIQSTFAYQGLTALHIAAWHGQAEIAKLLLEAGADINAVNNIDNFLNIPKQTTPLNMAVLFDKVSVVELLIRHNAKLGLADYNNKTPLTLAVELELPEITKLLVRSKAYLDQSKEATQKSLTLSLEKNNYEIASLLIINTGIDVNYDISFGNPPLFDAIKKDNTDFVSLLVKAGANVNHENHSKETPLYLAIRQGNLSMVSILVEAEGDVNYCYTEQKYRISKKGRSVEDGVITKPLLTIAIEEDFTDIAILLINSGASYNFEGPYSLLSPFKEAVALQRYEVLKLMFEIGVDSKLITKDQPIFFQSSTLFTESSKMLEIVQLDALKTRDQNNEMVLTKFLKYLGDDSSSSFGELPDSIISIIVQYSLGFYDTKLSELACDNYIKYHPIELSNDIPNSSPSLEIIGGVIN